MLGASSILVSARSATRHFKIPFSWIGHNRERRARNSCASYVLAFLIVLFLRKQFYNGILNDLNRKILDCQNEDLDFTDWKIWKIFWYSEIWKYFEIKIRSRPLIGQSCQSRERTPVRFEDLGSSVEEDRSPPVLPTSHLPPPTSNLPAAILPDFPFARG